MSRTKANAQRLSAARPPGVSPRSVEPADNSRIPGKLYLSLEFAALVRRAERYQIPNDLTAVSLIIGRTIFAIKP